MKKNIVNRFKRYKGKIGVDLAISIVEQETQDYVVELEKRIEYWRKQGCEGQHMMCQACSKVSSWKEFLECLK